ncbi:exported protein of unknown function [Cupriavidus taiwanensis]|nr:exported protein of unknown function [Cupriavidus taiwanensis]
MNGRSIIGSLWAASLEAQVYADPAGHGARVKDAGGYGKAGAGNDEVVVEGGHGGFRRAKGSSVASRGEGNVWRV